MRVLALFVAGFVLMIVSCNSPGSKPVPAAAAGPMKPQSDLGEEGTRLLTDVLGYYYNLKDELVAARAGTADSAAHRLVLSGNTLRSFIMHDTARVRFLRPFVDTIIAASVKIDLLTDETCEGQRLAFGNISSAMYSLLKGVNARNLGAYHEYCPMAFNDRGATWLSRESDIKNPYFGDKMLECGEVTDSL
jgi:hypothetical protein